MLAISAWIALKEGAPDQALKFMRAAADGEDGSVKHVAMENRLYPFRELFAELLLEMGQPAAALSEFEAALKQTPNRYRDVLGNCPCRKCCGRSPEGVRVLRQARGPGEERRHRTAGNPGGEEFPGTEIMTAAHQ